MASSHILYHVAPETSSCPSPQKAFFSIIRKANLSCGKFSENTLASETMGICFNFSLCTELSRTFSCTTDTQNQGIYEVFAFSLVQTICRAHINLQLTFNKSKFYSIFHQKNLSSSMQKPFPSLRSLLICMNKLWLGQFVSEQHQGIFSKYSSTALLIGSILMENPPWSRGQTSEGKFSSERFDASVSQKIQAKDKRNEVWKSC